jgi:hypothetical protein
MARKRAGWPEIRWEAVQPVGKPQKLLDGHTIRWEAVNPLDGQEIRCEAVKSAAKPQSQELARKAGGKR